ncbi:hypothetical protein GMDG_08153 [Pseudogymnoascus destructans 20631-21]|uniref:FAD-binding FR-type domain-containing protein n=1 Tax=Pseudogymnoascus destructans (strain ATCC MYA-4855 / 20631-21) TaxID=658429 RepID=L8G150_PSED2|nr:hypothetical protein GMDG_08153 [Pseudogymnoascus destructans 20631-21]
MADPKGQERAQQALNEKTAKSFGIAIGSLIALFILSHWARYFFHRYSNGSRSSATVAMIRLRRIRSLLSRRFFKQISVGRILLYILFWGINVIVSCTNVDLTNLLNVAKHQGWVALCNLALVIFLSLKNTPLAILSATSYETLMPLHKAAGYTCIVASLVHAIVYLVGMAQVYPLYYMLEPAPVAGMIGGIAMLLIGVLALPYIRRQRYELFYAIHVILSAITLIVVALHVPDLSRRAIIITLFAASLSFMDRAIRVLKFSCNFMGNHAALTALPNGATRVTLRQSSKAIPGSHAFLWLPAIRLVETHPFTLVSSDPAEFVVFSRGGFTSALHKYAKEFPAKTLRCSLNTGYGELPDFKTYDSILLIAGGSGASFTFAVALDLCRNPGPCPSGSITFVWVIRDKASISWFHAELRELHLDPRIKVMIHVTNNVESSALVSLSGYSEKDSPATAEESSQTSLPTMASGDSEKAIELEQMAASKKPVDPEKGMGYDVGEASSSTVATFTGRPNIPALMRSLVDNEDTTKRVIVGACGPAGLLETVKDTTSRCIRPYGPSFTLHTEGFGW